MSDQELSRFTRGIITAIITVISNHEAHNADEKLMQLRHERDKIVTGNIHLHLSTTHYLEVFITKSETNEIMNFIGSIRALKDIQHVRFTITPIT